MSSNTDSVQRLTDALQTITIVLYVFVAIALVWLAAKSLRIWRERRRAAQAPRRQHLIWRGDFIGALIQMVGQDTQPTRRCDVSDGFLAGRRVKRYSSLTR